MKRKSVYTVAEKKIAKIHILEFSDLVMNDKRKDWINEARVKEDGK